MINSSYLDIPFFSRSSNYKGLIRRQENLEKTGIIVSAHSARRSSQRRHCTNKSFQLRVCFRQERIFYLIMTMNVTSGDNYVYQENSYSTSVVLLETSTTTGIYFNLSSEMNLTTVTATKEPLDWLDFSLLAFLALTAFIGVFGNALIVFIQLKTIDIKSTDYLIAGLASVDIVDAIVLTTTNSMVTLSQNTMLSPPYCKLAAFFGFGITISSALFIGTLAVDRYFLTCKPFNKIYTVKVAKRIAVIIPVSVSILVSPFLVFRTHVPGEKSCSYIEGYTKVMNGLSTSLVVIVVVIFAVTLICYFNIALMLRGRVKKRMKDKSSGTKNQTEASFSDIQNSASTVSTLALSTNAEKEKHLGTKQPLPPGDGQKAREKPVKSKEKLAEQRANRTTLIMFLILVSFCFTWSAGIAFSFLINTLKSFHLKRTLLTMKRFAVVTNPVLFVSMSSKFREQVRQLICRSNN